MPRTPSALGSIQQKIPILIKPEDFGVDKGEVADCLAGLRSHEELCQDRLDLPGWVRNRVTDAFDAARAAGKAAREEREEVEAATVLESQVKGLAKHFGLSAEELVIRLELVADGMAEKDEKKAKKK